MSGQPGGTKHSHIDVPAMVALLHARPELREVMPLADALDRAARNNA